MTCDCMFVVSILMWLSFFDVKTIVDKNVNVASAVFDDTDLFGNEFV